MVEIALQIAAGFQSNALDAYDADHLVVVATPGKVYYTANATAALRLDVSRFRYNEPFVWRPDARAGQLGRRGRQRDATAVL